MRTHYLTLCYQTWGECEILSYECTKTVPKPRQLFDFFRDYYLIPPKLLPLGTPPVLSCLPYDLSSWLCPLKHVPGRVRRHDRGLSFHEAAPAIEVAKRGQPTAPSPQPEPSRSDQLVWHCGFDPHLFLSASGSEAGQAAAHAGPKRPPGPPGTSNSGWRAPSSHSL
jgi:hypothetical protein